jgi:hypothetical protein
MSMGVKKTTRNLHFADLAMATCLEQNHSIKFTLLNVPLLLQLNLTATGQPRTSQPQRIHQFNRASGATQQHHQLGARGIHPAQPLHLLPS